MVSAFKAFVVNKTEERFSAGFQSLTQADLPDGEVLIKVAYSSVNYKDGLASIPNGQVARRYPLIPGIDLSGTVVESNDAQFKTGDKVLATSYDMGVTHHGGFSEYARLKADWVIPLPSALTLKEAMIYGTAGLTAAISIYQLERMGLTPGQGPVLVTGATGGVGSMGVGILKKLGYSVTASTGKETEHEYLRQLGADEIISRAVTSAQSNRPLEKELWAGSLDSVGGSTLAYLLRTTKRGGSVATFGNTGGPNLSTTVFPFILRGVNLLGIDSGYCPMSLRRLLWERLATDYRPAAFDSIGHEISLEELPQALATILKGGIRGRVVVKIGE
jgi:acrylyl-CoA reductase (NADPH)